MRSFATLKVSGMLTLCLSLATAAWLMAGHRTTPFLEANAEIPGTARSDSEKSLAAVDVLYCHDGDTCRVMTQTGKLWFNVRLAGIDAPEVASPRKKGAGQAGGDLARDFLNETLKNRAVQLRQTDLDPYNRPVGEFLLDGKNINLVLVAQGMAEAYRGKGKRIDTSLYLEAEESAKKAKLGIWGRPTYQSPTEYRKNLKGPR